MVKSNPLHILLFFPVWLGLASIAKLYTTVVTVVEDRSNN